MPISPIVNDAMTEQPHSRIPDFEAQRVSSLYEYKFMIEPKRLPHIVRLLDSMYGNTDPYPAGEVTSIYFDTDGLACFEQCIEGEREKIKFRLRRYSAGESYQAQVKFKDEFSVRKLKFNIKKLARVPQTWSELVDVTDGFPLEMRAAALRYGRLSQSLGVYYRRRRYRVYDYRINIDSDIRVTRPGAKSPLLLPEAVFPFAVLEVKSPRERVYLPMLGLAELPQTSFSKYGRGMSVLRYEKDALAKYA